MPQGLTRLALAVALLASAVGVWGHNVVAYLNGVPYVFPSSQGAADEILAATDAAGTLAWATPTTSEGLWSGSVVLSTVACPSGWTRVAGADSRFLRGGPAWGVSAGADTHDHGLIGILGASVVGVTGTTAGSGVSISGSTAVAGMSHTHGLPSTLFDAKTSSPSTSAAAAIVAWSSDPSHSHAVGSLGGDSHTHSGAGLSGGSHGHATGTLAMGVSSNVPAHYNLIVCEMD